MVNLKTEDAYKIFSAMLSHLHLRCCFSVLGTLLDNSVKGKERRAD